MSSTGILFGAPKTGVSYFIPNEVVLHIFGFLPKPDLLVASRVSQSFYFLANDYSLWKRHCSKDLHGKWKTVEVISEIQGNQVTSQIPIGFKHTSFKLYVLACRYYILQNCAPLTPFSIHEEDSDYPNKANLLVTKVGNFSIEKKIICDNFIRSTIKLFSENEIANDDLLDHRLARINEILSPFFLACERKDESIVLTLSEVKNPVDLLNWALRNTYPEKDIRFLIENGATVTGYTVMLAIGAKYSKNFIGFLLDIKVKVTNYDLIQTALDHPEAKELIELLLNNGEEVSDIVLANVIHGHRYSDEIYELLITRKRHYSHPSEFLDAATLWNHSEKIIQLLSDRVAKHQKEDFEKEYKRPEKDIQLLLAHPSDELELPVQAELKLNRLIAITSLVLVLLIFRK